MHVTQPTNDTCLQRNPKGEDEWDTMLHIQRCVVVQLPLCVSAINIRAWSCAIAISVAISLRRCTDLRRCFCRFIPVDGVDLCYIKFIIVKTDIQVCHKYTCASDLRIESCQLFLELEILWLCFVWSYSLHEDMEYLNLKL